MTKEYLKMADVFRGGEHHSDIAGIGGVIDTNGEFILQTIENNYCSNMLQGDRNEYRDTIAKYASHAINSHDELVAEVERLRCMIDGLEREYENIIEMLLKKLHEADVYCQELQGIIDSLQ